MAAIVVPLLIPTEEKAPARNSERKPNSSFSLQLPTLQLAWDSTSLGEFKACQRRYQYTIILGYTPNAENVHFKFGIDFHSSMELYDHLMADGIGHKKAQIEAVKLALDNTWDKELDRPWQSTNPYKNRYTLIRSIVDYTDFYENDPIETFILANGQAAVELSFRFELGKTTTITQVDCPNCLGSGDIAVVEHTLFGEEIIVKDCPNCSGKGSVGEHFLVCGHFDKLGNLKSLNNKLWIVDKKTTKLTLNRAYFAKYSPNNQISCYSGAGKVVFGIEIAGVIIDGIQILKESTNFRRGIIERTPSTISEWMNDLDYYLSLAEVSAERNYWPMNDLACGEVWEDPDSGQLHYGCPFRPVCGAAPEIRQKLLDLNYKKRIWDPLKTRERQAAT